jgi:hypothetical protein
MLLQSDPKYLISYGFFLTKTNDKMHKWAEHSVNLSRIENKKINISRFIVNGYIRFKLYDYMNVSSLLLQSQATRLLLFYVVSFFTRCLSNRTEFVIGSVKIDKIERRILKLQSLNAYNR